MRTMKRRATRDQLTKRNMDQLPDGIDGTITGGPMEPIDVMEILGRGTRGVSRGGAVSGAAQVMVSSPGASVGQDRGIALSDGSRITFTSVADVGVVKDDNVHTDEPAPVAGDSRVSVYRDGHARVPSAPTRVLTAA